jgi:hypothetical protein
MSDKCYIVNLNVNLLTSVNYLMAEGRGTPGKPMGPIRLIGSLNILPLHKRVFPIRVTETHKCAEIPGAPIAQGIWGNGQNGIAIERIAL